MDTICLHWIRNGIALVLILALSACANIPATVQPSASATTAPTQTKTTPTIKITATASATPTLEATLGPPPIAGPDVSFENVHFRLPEELGQEVYAQLAPATDILGEPYPAYVEFMLSDYPSQNTDFEPQIKVYSVRELGENPTQTVQKLRDLLRDQPADLPAGIPILPTLNAGQLVDVQMRYLTFSGGSGIGVLTAFAQNFWPVSNEQLVYVFQGLTNDDAYYISAFLPVSASFLPNYIDEPEKVPPVDGVPFPVFNSPNFDQEYINYQRAIIAKLEGMSSEEFQPSLGTLDSLIESLQVDGVAESASAPCVNSLPTRLHVNGFAYLNPDPPIPNNLRREPGSDSDLTGEIQPGERMKILEGPACADGWVWWKVRTFDSESTGWTAEGNRQNYWLVPCPSRNECGPS